MPETPTQCWQCETPLAPEYNGDDDAGYERDGDLWCYECYTEKYQFICAWCEDFGDVDDQHQYLLVFDAEEAGLDVPGVYRVTDLPYYTSALIGGGWMWQQSLQYLGPLPRTVQPEYQEYPCGHLCLECQREMLAELVRRGYSQDV